MRTVPVSCGALLAAFAAAGMPAGVTAANACAAAPDTEQTPLVTPPRVDADVVKSCAVSTSDAAGARLADARRGGGLRTALPGSVAFDPNAGGPPPFGAGEPVVLIGEAANVRDLLAHCARLHDAGYTNVRVLAGGIDAWRRAGKLPPTDGTAASLLSAAELARRASVAPHALVFDAGADAGLRDLGDVAQAARRGESPSTAAARIARLLERRRVMPGIDPIVVVLADRHAAGAWRDAWNATAYPDPQFYVGTDAEFRAAVAQGARIAAERGKPLPGPCDR